jgi:hypothetical protein
MRRTLAAAVCVLFAIRGFAQDRATRADNPPENVSVQKPDQPELRAAVAPNGSASKPDRLSATKTEEEVEKQRLEQSYRVMGVLPMFDTTSRPDAKPLASAEKFHLFVKSVSDPMAFVMVGMQARISQLRNSFPAYGQGATGYLTYYGAAMADSVESNFFSNFFYPVLFKQDPRYFRLGQGGFRRRTVHALLQEFKARKDSGGETFHYSNVLGALTAGGIANAYYPGSSRGFGLTMDRTGIALLNGSLGGMLAEFWPDVQRKLFKNKQRRGLKMPDTDASVPALTPETIP